MVYDGLNKMKKQQENLRITFAAHKTVVKPSVRAKRDAV